MEDLFGWRLAALFILLPVLILGANAAEAIDIVATGACSETIGASDLVGGAGTDLQGAYESSSDEVAISIINTSGNDDNWRVDVKRTDSTWHGDFKLWVKRTGDGSGGGTIAGGGAYQEVGTAYSGFFSGTGDRNDIRVQLKLSGVSVQVPPHAYSASITYTVVDTL